MRYDVAEHFVKVCQHGTIYGTCRCAAPNKVHRLVPCTPRCPHYGEPEQTVVQDSVELDPAEQLAAELAEPVPARQPRHSRFQLIRQHDVTGISGTGLVAEGVQFSDGTVVMRWLKSGTSRPEHVKPTTVVHDDIDSVIALHGHGGATFVRWVEHPGFLIPADPGDMPPWPAQPTDQSTTPPVEQD